MVSDRVHRPSVLERWEARKPGIIFDSLEWDVVNWSAALHFWQAETAKTTFVGQSALEVGAGSGGGLTLWLASQGMPVTWSSYGQSKSNPSQVHCRHGVESNISYRYLDVLDPAVEERYDIVVMKSVLGLLASGGLLDRAQLAITNMRTLLRPGGELWLVENLRATGVHQFLRDRCSWGKKGAGWYYPSLAEFRQLLEPFDEYAVMTAGVLGLGGRTESQRSVLGALDALLLERLVPPGWRYIGAAVARTAR